MKKKINILLAVENLSLGCTAKNVINNAVSLTKAGHSVVIYSEKDGPRSVEIASKGIRLITNRIEDSLLLEFSILHLHGAGQFSDFLYNLSARAKKLNAEIKTLFTNIFGGYDEKLFSNIDGQAFVSFSCAHKYYSRGYPSLRNEYVIYNQVFVDRLIDHKKFKNSNLTIGRIGRPDLSKWSNDNVEIINRLKNRDIQFKLVGCPLPIRQKIQHPNVEYIDSIYDTNELDNFYKSIDVLLHLSKIGESFGCIFVEAMSHGVPVVTKASPLKKRNFWTDNAQAEIVTNKKTGFVCLDNTSIVNILKNNKKIYALDNELIQKVAASQFGDDKILNKLERCYFDIFNGKPRSLCREKIKTKYKQLNERTNLEYTPWYGRLYDHFDSKLFPS